MHPDAHDTGPCSRCTSPLPTGAAYCPGCGADVARHGPAGALRTTAWAAHPDHGTHTPRVIPTLMPLVHGSGPRTYATALGIGVAAVAVLALIGWSGPALVAAALLVPTLLVIGQHDASVWDDKPAATLVGTVGLGAGLGAAVTIVWSVLLVDDPAHTASNGGTSTATAGWSLAGDGTTWTLTALFIACIAVPVVTELLRQTGPATVTARPRFDDVLDRVTFGLATGATWAAAEALVLDRGLITGTGPLGDATLDSALRTVTGGGERVAAAGVVLAAGIVTPIGIAAATAIAATAFPGAITLRAHRSAAATATGTTDLADLPTWRLRRTARRTLRRNLRPRIRPLQLRYALAVGEAIVYGAVLHLARALGARLGGPTGAALWLAVAIVITAIALVRLRMVVHDALLDSARRALNEGRLSRHAAIGDAWCGHCETPLSHGAAFCSTCGMAVRAAGKRRRAFNSDPHTRLLATTSGRHR